VKRKRPHYYKPPLCIIWPLLSRQGQQNNCLPFYGLGKIDHPEHSTHNYLRLCCCHRGWRNKLQIWGRKTSRKQFRIENTERINSVFGGSDANLIERTQDYIQWLAIVILVFIFRFHYQSYYPPPPKIFYISRSKMWTPYLKDMSGLILSPQIY
jgi:hypothetical protein